MNTLDYLKNYYSTHDEDSRLLSRHGSVEFLTTMRYIQKYLKKGNTVLEIGAGTGRYSHAIASRCIPGKIRPEESGRIECKVGRQPQHRTGLTTQWCWMQNQPAGSNGQRRLAV